MLRSIYTLLIFWIVSAIPKFVTEGKFTKNLKNRHIHQYVWLYFLLPLAWRCSIVQWTLSPQWTGTLSIYCTLNIYHPPCTHRSAQSKACLRTFRARTSYVAEAYSIHIIYLYGIHIKLKKSFRSPYRFSIRQRYRKSL